MNGRNLSDVHTCVAKWSISWDGTFCSEVNHKIVVKLNTGCVQNVVTTWRGVLGRPRLGTDAEDSFFPGTGDTYPHLDEIHGRRGDESPLLISPPCSCDAIPQAHIYHPSWYKQVQSDNIRLRHCVLVTVCVQPT
jgi:hypothetical protein